VMGEKGVQNGGNLQRNSSLACVRSGIYDSSMTFNQRVPVERLLGFDFQKGDTLKVVEVENSAFVVQVSRAEVSAPAHGKASEWLKSARGSVKLAPGETVDDLRMGFYASKYGVTS